MPDSVRFINKYYKNIPDDMTELRSAIDTVFRDSRQGKAVL